MRRIGVALAGLLLAAAIAVLAPGGQPGCFGDENLPERFFRIGAVRGAVLEIGNIRNVAAVLLAPEHVYVVVSHITFTSS